VQPVDILILSNGPGELATWVKPTVRSLRQILGTDEDLVRISLILSPCPHANGQEAEVARKIPEINRVQAAEYFWPFLLLGKTHEQWDWRSHGVVLFLGGDQLFPVLASRRLGYASVTYAEWEARWLPWIDAVGAMNAKVLAAVPQRYHKKIQVVGDLMTEVNADPTLQQDQRRIQETLNLTAEIELIGLLPGSKVAKITQGVPLLLAIAQQIHRQRPQTRFVIPVAPTLSVETLAQYADRQFNSWTEAFDGVSAQLVYPQTHPSGEMAALPYLETASGLRVELWTQTPHYGLFSLCQFCLTTVGANTAELGSLGVPMIVLLPTQQLDAMRSWDGIPGMLTNMPGVGSYFARLINWIAQRYLGLLAWPNIWAGKMIVPELIGQLNSEAVAAIGLSWLQEPERLSEIRIALQEARGQSGAALKLAGLVAEQLQEFPNHPSKKLQT
jgi:lipid A disaccharide synthetase